MNKELIEKISEIIKYEWITNYSNFNSDVPAQEIIDLVNKSHKDNLEYIEGYLEGMIEEADECSRTVLIGGIKSLLNDVKRGVSTGVI